MKSKFKIILILFNFFIIFAYPQGIGTSGSFILQRVMSAKAYSLSGAYSSFNKDINAIYHNPAGLGNISSHNILITYQRGAVAEDQFSLFSYGNSFPFGTFAITFGYYDAGMMELIDIYANEKLVKAETDIFASLTYAEKFEELLPNTWFGMNVKFLSTNIAETKSSYAFASDIGINTSFLNELIKFGFVVHNIGIGAKFFEKTENLPINFQLGVSTNFAPVSSHFICISIDGVYLLFEQIHELLTGIEYSYNKILFLRIGYSYPNQKISYGIGFSYPVIFTKIGIDFFIDFNKELGNTIITSLNISF
jgi:hypothetical protein